MAGRWRASPLAREALAEFVSTFILVIFGCGSVAQAVLSKQNNGTFFSINFSWAMGVTMGCYWAGGVSGAHMNPAVTLALSVAKRFPWRKLPAYWLSQLVGAFVASACLYAVYYDALNAFDGGVRQILGVNGTAGIWATYPQPYLSTAGGFGDQFLGTALLVGCVFAITDQKNNAPSKGTTPIAIGLVVFVIGSTFGFNCGYAINPARDLGPRIFTAVAGWGGDVFTVCNYWAWVPVVGCLLGGIAGAVLYIVIIDMHHPLPDSHDVLQEVKIETGGNVELANIEGQQNSAFVTENGAERKHNGNIRDIGNDSNSTLTAL